MNCKHARIWYLEWPRSCWMLDLYLCSQPRIIVFQDKIESWRNTEPVPEPPTPDSISALINAFNPYSAENVKRIHARMTYKRGPITTILLDPGSLLVLIKTCPESRFTAWREPISLVSMEKVSSGVLLMPPVLLWHVNTPGVLSGCPPFTADSALGSFGSLFPLPFLECSILASGIHTLIQLNPQSKPIKTLYNTGAQRNLSAF